jgi:aspartyl-tRNA(Asn)/glutamyl-tRNA(Gln) amidotransferase subunit A
MEPRELTIREAVEAMRTGGLTAEALLESCLERIRSREATVKAWVEVYEGEARAEACRCDEESKEGRRRGPLHGIPLGVKDIIDVKGQWTRCGSPVYPANIPEQECPAVARLRAAGAILLGKTQTTPFANNDPTVTRNPWNPDHTPGGSSSGSGAAVADRMCLAALGTQTGGSLLRPAAYNGVVGFKATYGRISAEGVVPNAWSLDHVGFLCRSAADASLLWSVMQEEEPRPFGRMPDPPCCSLPRNGDPPVLGLIRDFFEAESAPEVVDNLASVCRALIRAGARIVEVSLPPSFAFVTPGWDTIQRTELYAYHRPLFEAYGQRYPPHTRWLLEQGREIAGHEYAEYLRHRIRFQREMFQRLGGVHAVLTPSVPATAPRGLESTGPNIFQRPWSFAGFPALSIPAGRDAAGLPFGVQIAAQPYAEETLLEVAAWCEGVLGFQAAPALA